MIESFEKLRTLTPVSGILRLLCAILFGGMIGMNRERKGRAAGFRTYMLVCMGAAMTMMLGQYEHMMVAVLWAESAVTTGIRIDVSRFGAQVINGIGFLGTGTIIVTGHQRVQGVTTAAGLWASACMGLAIGAGFYECMLFGFIWILLCFQLLPLVENHISACSRDINIYVEFDGVEFLEQIFTAVKALNVQIYDIQIDDGRETTHHRASAVFYLRLFEKRHHTEVLSELAKIQGIRLVDEV